MTILIFNIIFVAQIQSSKEYDLTISTKEKNLRTTLHHAKDDSITPQRHIHSMEANPTTITPTPSYFKFPIKTLVPAIDTGKCKMDQAVVVRFKNPTKSQLERYVEWESGFNSTFDVWYIIHRDDPNISYPFDKTFYISTKELMDNYKELNDLRKPNHCVEQLNRDDSEFYMWISHSESIILWYETIGRCYNNIWILEQDVGYSGKFSDFLNSYNSDISDLISYDIREDSPSSYWHYYCESDKYMKYQKEYQSKQNLNEVEYTSREFIQRWSKKLIEIIENEVNNGYHAISETSVAQAVIYHNLTYKLFDKESIGKKWDWFHKIKKGQWSRFQRISKRKNKLYHPLKFL